VTIAIAELRERQVRFAARLQVLGLEGAVVVSRGGGTFDRHGDVYYLTGHYQPFVYLPENPPRWSGRSHTVAVVRSDAEVALCVSVPEEFGHRGLAVDDIRWGDNFIGVVAGTLRDLGLAQGKVGIVGLDVLPGNLWDALRAEIPDAAFRRIDEELASLRRIKSSSEQQAIREASAMGRRGVTAFLGTIAPGISEAEAVAAAAEEVVRSGGAMYLLAASSGVLSSSYTTDPLPGFGRRGLEDGDIVRFDLVAVLDGYLTDFGRTVVVGEASNKQRQLLDRLHSGLDAAIGAVRPGVPVRNVVAAGDAALAEAGVGLEPGSDAELAAAYPPHWGHGLGLGWERPWFVESEDLVIEEGMYLAIERSIVMHGVGTAAAEQNLLVDADGSEVLTEGGSGRWT
jgi:Xaa-Pro dipeptidase